MFVNKNFRCEQKEAEVIDRKTQCTAMCSFRHKDYCFGTWIKERVTFMCSVLVSAHGLLFRHID